MNSVKNRAYIFSFALSLIMSVVLATLFVLIFKISFLFSFLLVITALVSSAYVIFTIDKNIIIDLFDSIEISKEFKIRNHKTRDSVFRDFESILNSSLLINSLFKNIFPEIKKLTLIAKTYGIGIGRVEKNSASLLNSIKIISKNLTKTSTAIDQIFLSSEKIKNNADEITKSITTSSEFLSINTKNSKATQKDLTDVIAQMHKVAEFTHHTTSLIDSLEQKSNKVQQVSKMIDDIASQTNLLSLNAGVESSRSGEHGSGFTVVSKQIKDLSEKTRIATSNVDHIIYEIRNETINVKSTMSVLSALIYNGVENLERIGNDIEVFLHKSDNISKLINDISGVAESNNKSLTSISNAMNTLKNQLTIGTKEMHNISEQTEQIQIFAEVSQATIATFALNSHHEFFYQLALNAKNEIEDIFTKNIDTVDLFDTNYSLIPNTNPKQYNSAFDSFTDKVLPQIQESVFEKSDNILYAIAMNKNGYIPTHNLKYSQAQTGNFKVDQQNSRTKIIAQDPKGLKSAQNTSKILLQTFEVFTGDIVHDLSLPIFVNNQHWGAFRIGYKPSANQ